MFSTNFLVFLLLPIFIAAADMANPEAMDMDMKPQPDLDESETGAGATTDVEIVETETGINSKVECYICNSGRDPVCSDPFFTTSPAINERYLYNCTEKNGLRPFCRKVSAYMDLFDMVRVDRECGYKRRKGRLCYQRRSEQFVKDICACNTDRCNGATGISAALALLLAPLVAKML